MTRDLFNHATIESVAPIIDGPRLDLVLHHETQTDIKTRGAILVSEDGYETKAVWLQKSKIEFTRGSLNANGIRRNGQRVVLPVVSVTMPKEMAREKGLI
jgi:hypothetical protein